ncbi:hypothetical protein DYH09_17065 [bacterium CPR1]|nr:hypothetical protein [bacterium CPR1]
MFAVRRCEVGSLSAEASLLSLRAIRARKGFLSSPAKLARMTEELEQLLVRSWAIDTSDSATRSR